MKVFRFRLEGDSGEFREGGVAAESKDEAKEILDRREYGLAAYRLTTVEMADLEKKEKADGLAPDEKARLAAHRQAKPYKLVSLKEG